MENDIHKIKDRSLGELLDNFFICECCHIVDTDSRRTDRGFKCPSCKEIDDRGMGYYSTQVTSLINLMQEFYHTHQMKTDNKGESHIPFWAGNIKLPVIIFFATLRELLLNNLIDELLKAKKINGDICKRLLDDSPTHAQRMDKLFRSLTGKKWKSALRQIDQNEGTDFISLDTFIKKVVDARNDFLHSGSTWEIEDDMPEECLKKIYSMLKLHMYLHNYFVYTIYDFERDE